MPRGIAGSKAEAFKNLKLDSDFFSNMLSKREDGLEEYRDFDVYLMEKSVMPLLLQGLDALSRHVDAMTSKGASPSDSKTRFNPLVWLAQYLLRNHPRYVKDHRTPMYERFAELANVERGRRCILRRRDQMEAAWQQLVEDNGGPLTVDDIPDLFEVLDKKWYLDGALIEKLPQDYKNVGIVTGGDETDKDLNEVCFIDFWKWFEDFIKSNDILRAVAFADAERRQLENEQKAKKAEEDKARRERAVQEAMEQRTELELQFEAFTADMFVDEELTSITSKGAVIDGVEEKEGGPPLQGEHIYLIRSMLRIWGRPVEDADPDGDVWNDSALAAWQLWLKDRGIESTKCVDKKTLGRLMDKDEFEEYLQQAFPVKDEDADDDYVTQLVEVRGFIEDDIDLLVEVIDEETAEILHMILPDHEAEALRQRLQTATTNNPVLATADRVSGRIVELMPEHGH